MSYTYLATTVALVLTSSIAYYYFHYSRKKLIPISVNYHFTRDCNYNCGFCFHTKKTRDLLDIDTAKTGLKALKDNGMRKINFAGGEPFLYPKFLGQLVQYCKEDLKLESVSIVSNGSKIKENWFERYGQYLDILAISCDSFDEETNIKIGRGKGDHLDHVYAARDLCIKYGVKFKINSVINVHNWNEDMHPSIIELAPFRWKVFQVLLLEGENSGSDALRDATSFLIQDEQFKSFVDRHKDLDCLVPEDNSKMKNSYLILDEKMRFLNCTGNGKDPSESILDVGVTKALQQSGFDPVMFKERGGVYSWNRMPNSDGCGKLDPKLEW